jgi:Tol biopolymer transport system component
MGMRRTVLLLASMVLAVLLVSTACLVATENTAQAAFPGNNGRIAFANSRDGSDSEIYTVSPKGGDLRRLTRNTAEDWGPAFSPDGKKIVFYSAEVNTDDPDLDFDIYVMNADGSNRTLVTDESKINGRKGQDMDPSFSPNGRQIVFVRDRPIGSDPSTQVTNYELYKIRVDGRNLTRITRYGNDPLPYVQSPVWSPDGSRIAYTYLDSSFEQIKTIGPDGTGEKTLTDGYAPDWSPDGSRIVHLRRIDEVGHRAVFTMDKDGNDPIQLPVSGGYPAYSPDGLKIVFTSGDGLSTMDTNGNNVQSLTPLVGSFPDWQPVP